MAILGDWRGRDHTRCRPVGTGGKISTIVSRVGRTLPNGRLSDDARSASVDILNFGPCLRSNFARSPASAHEKKSLYVRALSVLRYRC